MNVFFFLKSLKLGEACIFVYLYIEILHPLEPTWHVLYLPKISKNNFKEFKQNVPNFILYDAT